MRVHCSWAFSFLILIFLIDIVKGWRTRKTFSFWNPRISSDSCLHKHVLVYFLWHQQDYFDNSFSTNIDKSKDKRLIFKIRICEENKKYNLQLNFSISIKFIHKVVISGWLFVCFFVGCLFVSLSDYNSETLWMDLLQILIGGLGITMGTLLGRLGKLSFQVELGTQVSF